MAVPAVLWLAGCGTAPAAGGVSPSPASAAAAGAATTEPTSAPATSSATDSPAGEADPAAPARIRLTSLDVDVPVVQVGVDGSGEMEVPFDVQTAGWYRFGPGPGSAAGSSVVSGHVDDRVQGRGAFYGLTDLDDGDPVQVTLADGTVLDYRVETVERVDKSQLPVEQVFARDGAPRLTLVTCGGEFDQAARSYRENVVVTAVPDRA